MPPCKRQRRFPAMGYFAHGVPERVFAPHSRGLVIGTLLGLCSYIIFCRLQEGVNPISPHTISSEANLTHKRNLTDLSV